MKKKNINIITASDRSVVNTGKVKGNISIGLEDNSQQKKTKNFYLPAIITAVGAIISGLLVASSNFFK